MNNKLNNNKRVFRKTVISEEEYNLIISEAAAAWEFLNSERFKPVREILLSAKEYAQNSILENTIMDVDEVVTISERIKKVFKQTKKVQLDELSGQYKLINKFFSELQEYVDIKESLEEKIASDQVSVERISENA